MKRLQKHRNGEISIRLTDSEFHDLMSHLNDCNNKNTNISLKILEDEIIDEENH